MRSLDNAQDQQGQDIDLRPASDVIYQLDLLADTSARITIPAGATRVIFGACVNYWIKLGDSSVTAVNSGDITDGSASELNPQGYTLSHNETHIAAISDADGQVTMAFYTGGYTPTTLG